MLAAHVQFTECSTCYTAHRTITVKELEPLVTELAKAYAKDKDCEVDTAKAELKDKLIAAEPKLHGATVSFQLFIKSYRLKFISEEVTQ